ncbi:hypothetical protein V8G54_024867 [Vigna mungo]|uniref:DNA-directed RNA polymerase II subunit RPB9-like zinc ribbon domain-containing protein n=1 Tax=Vigna mungo TaxID=3915 RepID=A0AAQ3N7K0_VIGMU
MSSFLSKISYQSDLITTMEFCPTCGNMLQFELPYLDQPSRFFCSACPYVCHVNNRVKIKRKQRLVKKEIEPIISPDDMKNAPKTEAALVLLLDPGLPHPGSHGSCYWA